MRKKQTQTLAEVLSEYLQENQLGDKLKVSSVKKYWEQLMGKIIAQKTTNIYIKNRKLYISLNSSVLRNELLMMRSRIVKMMNEKMQGNYIDDVNIR